MVNGIFALMPNFARPDGMRRVKPSGQVARPGINALFIFPTAPMVEKTFALIPRVARPDGKVSGSCLHRPDGVGAFRMLCGRRRNAFWPKEP